MDLAQKEYSFVRPYNALNLGHKILCPLDQYKIGPGVLARATRGGGRSEAGHCFHLLFSLFFFFLFLRLLLFTHFGETPVAEIFSPPYKLVGNFNFFI